MKWPVMAAGAGLALLLYGAQASTLEVETIPIRPSADQSATDIPAVDLEPPATERLPEAGAPASADGGPQSLPEALPAPQVFYDTSSLPKPVARMHAQMREAALSGDLQRIRMILESNEVMPTLSFAEIGDPIDFLKESSGDGDGFEILAILADILEAGYVHVDAGTPFEMYVWPYFARYPLQELTPDQKVELYRIVTSGDYAEMQDYGAWTFYRVGIGPDGTLHYFVAGD